MREDRQIKLIYSGRVTETKNVDIMLLTLKELLNVGVKARLDIVGGCSESYMGVLMGIIQKEKIPNSLIKFHGPRSFDYIANQYQKSHYFLFPSQEPKEGHSNSLTEAMAFGVVPIVSNVGFNTSICGLREFVVEEITPRAFAEKILWIEDNGQWKILSKYVYQRFLENYTEERAVENIKQASKLMGLLE